MCGFAGLLVAGGVAREALGEEVRHMRDKIVHRGPDDSGCWVNDAGTVGFGFRRLSIIDLSERGHQPMMSPGGRYAMMFNGEIFNFRELRRELESRGCTFLGHSDSEVLVNGFEQWGVEPFIKRCVGMFAIAVWDHRENALHLIRDRVGKKPLFVSQLGDTVLFASELKSLVASPRFRGELNENAVAAFLRYLYVPAPLSIYTGTSKVEPGHILTIRANGTTSSSSRAYWSLRDAYTQSQLSRFTGTEQDATSQLDTLLQDAIGIRMESDVPLGSLLSGGVDSSLVTAIMQRASDKPVRTFSIGFTSNAHDESVHAAAVAKHLGTHHTALRLSGKDALDVVPRLPEMFDEPLADPSQIPTYLVSALARREVTVALTGDGGDEVFGGYHRYIDGQRWIGMLDGLPQAARWLLQGLAAPVTPASVEAMVRLTGSNMRLPAEKLAKLKRLLGHADSNAMYRSLLSAWDPPEAAMLRKTSHADPTFQYLEELHQLPLLDRMMLSDQHNYLPDDLLAKVDRASMAVSLEARVPLLDHRVIEFAMRLPQHFKIRGGRGKYLLRAVLDRYVPRELIERPKVGFSVPLDEWLRGPLRPWGESLIAALEPPLDKRAVEGVWSRFQNGAPGLGLSLWTVLVFEGWRQRWLGS